MSVIITTTSQSPIVPPALKRISLDTSLRITRTGKAIITAPRKMWKCPVSQADVFTQLAEDKFSASPTAETGLGISSYLTAYFQ